MSAEPAILLEGRDGKSYYSFLLCCHPGQPAIVNLYYSGIPLGVLRDRVFEPHQFTMADGIKRPLTINDLPHPCSFKTLDEMIADVRQTLATVVFDSITFA